MNLNCCSHRRSGWNPLTFSSRGGGCQAVHAEEDVKFRRCGRGPFRLPVRIRRRPAGLHLPLPAGRAPRAPRAGQITFNSPEADTPGLHNPVLGPYRWSIGPVLCGPMLHRYGDGQRWPGRGWGLWRFLGGCVLGAVAFLGGCGVPGGLWRSWGAVAVPGGLWRFLAGATGVGGASGAEGKSGPEDALAPGPWPRAGEDYWTGTLDVGPESAPVDLVDGAGDVRGLL